MKTVLYVQTDNTEYCLRNEVFNFLVLKYFKQVRFNLDIFPYFIQTLDCSYEFVYA